MAKYTTQLRHIVESGVTVFDFDYPIFDEKYRGVLETKIINRYFFREIGHETFAQFKHYLKTRLNEIMPYYNQMYESEGLITKDDYFINLNTTEKHTRTVDQTSEGKSESTGNATATNSGKNVFSDTPQSAMADTDKYATTVTKDDETTVSDSSGDMTSSGTAKTIEEYTTEMLGGGGMRYNADILMEWRKSFLNIDKQICDELNDLFMGVY
jgi:hypothetical protein